MQRRNGRAPLSSDAAAARPTASRTAPATEPHKKSWLFMKGLKLEHHVMTAYRNFVHEVLGSNGRKN
jgi:hypothetical protein